MDCSTPENLKYIIEKNIKQNWLLVLIHLNPIILGGQIDAFSVGLEQNEFVQKGEVVVYKDIITNYSNSTTAGYNLTTGKYYAPKEGIYIFFYHSMAEDGQVCKFFCLTVCVNEKHIG